MEAGPCIGCSGGDFSRIYEFSGSYPATIVICHRCDLVQLAPMPTDAELAELYRASYFESAREDRGYCDYALQEDAYLHTFAEEIQRVQKFVSRGRFLDVGCGYGYMLQVALDAGYDAFGLDRSADAVARASERFPGRVYCGDLSDLRELSERTFDVVFASHLIEHIPRPVPFLHDLAARLRPAGVLVLVTPNIESWLARLSGRRWVSFKIPEHVAYYSPSTLAALVEDAGLEVLDVQPAHQYYRVPFLARRIRELLRPLSACIPPFEDLPGLRERTLRVTSGSMRLVARTAGSAAVLSTTDHGSIHT